MYGKSRNSLSERSLPKKSFDNFCTSSLSAPLEKIFFTLLPPSQLSTAPAMTETPPRCNRFAHILLRTSCRPTTQSKPKLRLASPWVSKSLSNESDKAASVLDMDAMKQPTAKFVALMHNQCLRSIHSPSARIRIGQFEFVRVAIFTNPAADPISNIFLETHFGLLR